MTVDPKTQKTCRENECCPADRWSVYSIHATKRQNNTKGVLSKTHFRELKFQSFLSAHLCSEQVDWREVQVLMVQVYRQAGAAVLGPDLLLLTHWPHLLLLKHTQEWHHQCHYRVHSTLCVVYVTVDILRITQESSVPNEFQYYSRLSQTSLFTFLFLWNQDNNCYILPY